MKNGGKKSNGRDEGYIEVTSKTKMMVLMAITAIGLYAVLETGAYYATPSIYRIPDQHSSRETVELDNVIHKPTNVPGLDYNSSPT
jgi:hypothetical protein